jgi:glyoxylase-like metal-dependent hydrolase (beta-lactamase superfamily II)
MALVLSLEMLPADYGDCLHLTYGEGVELHHLLIDGGLTRSYRRGWEARARALGAAGQALDLLVVTHIDNDHVAGGRAFVADDAAAPFLPLRAVWFNQYRHIRAFAAPEPAPAGPAAEVRPRFFQAAGRWRSRAEFVREVARRAPGLAGLAGRQAATLPPLGAWRAAAWRGPGLSELLSGA